MIDLICAPCISCALALLFTPLARSLAVRCRLVDQPDGHRKLHREATPLAGGLAIFLASCATLTLMLLLPPSLVGEHTVDPVPFLGLLPASLLICLLGVADDYGRLRGRHKLLGQTAAVAVVIAFGVQVRMIDLCGWHLELGLLSIPFTAFLLLGAINSLNLLDGMDGLLSSVGLIICVGMAAMAALGERWMAVWVALTLAGALLGFLRYNLPPASIFLGDSGSMLIGLVIGVLAIQSSLKGAATVALAAPTALLTIPIFDTVAAIVRRKLTGRSLYTTDRGHLHHCLLRSGLSSRWVLVLVGLLSLVTVAGAMATLIYKSEFYAFLSALVVIASLVFTRLFGHAEWTLVQKGLNDLLVSLFVPRARGKAREVEIRLQGSIDWTDLWNRLTEAAEHLCLNRIRLDVNVPLIHEGYHARWERWDGKEDEAALWRTEIPLVSVGRTVGRLEVVGTPDALCVSTKVAVLAQLAREIECALTSQADKTRAVAAVRPSSPSAPWKVLVDGDGADEDVVLDGVSGPPPAWQSPP